MERSTQRRRGAELESALLDAAWAELLEAGYDGFTIDAVAIRAGTSRAVLYRRWPTKQDLVRAALGHGAGNDLPPPPQTGSLRGDLIALLRQANQTRIDVATLVMVRLGAYYKETGTSIADLREVMPGNHQAVVQQIIERAVERGEIDPAKLTPRIARLPFDLFRYELMMTLEPVPDATIEEIIDTTFLPLVTPGRTPRRPRRPGAATPAP
ncbi:TetR/AcrR family transcriptional regulator [Dactylosporangium sp. CA-233914]|uniref:TetR/AcrR family transcriptional regulator n=1 Tax=Dactylosporangium sp. CA-233914 TaxID=3239934 RepID=UPI003D8E87C7